MYIRIEGSIGLQILIGAACQLSNSLHFCYTSSSVVGGYVFLSLICGSSIRCHMLGAFLLFVFSFEKIISLNAVDINYRV